MLSEFPVALTISVILGFLAGLGVGGGSLLILWLTLVLKLPYDSARTINLLFFLPSATISSVFRWKQGALKLQKILPGIISGCISAALFAIISKQAEAELLQKLFGILLLATGTRELLYRPKN